MRKKRIKKIINRQQIGIIVSLLLLVTSMAVVVGISDERSSSFSIMSEEIEPIQITVQTIDDVTRISYHISSFTQETVMINGEEYKRIALSDESNILKKGFPDLPNICRSVIIPDDKLMKIRILDSNYVEYNNIDVAPSKGNLPRTTDPNEVPYEFEDFYQTDSPFPKLLAELSEPYILRNYRGIVVKVNPFRYNPVQKTLRFFTDITLEVFPDGFDNNNCIYRDESPSSIDVDFLSIYSHHFMNFASGDRYDLVPEQGNMLVICYHTFAEEMQPFVDWKNTKGIPTEMALVPNDIDQTASAIDTYIENYYFDNGLTFVLLVGDIAQIPSMDSPYSSHASDPSYAYIVGSDNYQDIFVGRFSAQNEDQVITQVERSVEYEKYPEIGANWYDKGAGTASAEGGPGLGDDDEYDWEHIRNLRNLLLGFTYSYVDEFYSGSQGEDDAPGEPETSAVLSSLNEGRSIFNHCGHGAWDGIGWSSMPGWYILHSDDIDTLTNDNKLPYVVLVACNPGEFENFDSCFAETWMRATNNGEPTGAIGVFASTQSQSWAPPMEAQDEIIDLLVSSTYNTMGGLSYSGTMSMMDDYGSGCYDETDTWTLFGDPSLQLRTQTPIPLTVNHDTVIFEGSLTYELDVPGVEGALCAISVDNQLLGYGYTDASGHATISFLEPVTDVEAVTLVVTSFNYDTYITSLDLVSKRQPAEFERMQGVLIRYPFGISYQIIAEMAEDAQVVTIVTGPAEENTVRSLYESNGVNLDNCIFLYAPTDSYWTRDYGPWFVYDVEGNQTVIDFEYNRPRPLDNAIPAAFAAEYGLLYQYMDIVHSGGNYMTDGQSISVSTDLVDTENPGLTIDDIQDLAADYLGIRTYHIIPDALGEYIEHIDCWAKFLSPESILILEVPPGHDQYDELEGAVDYFESQITCYGTPYDIVRIYAPNGEPYTNSLILNDKVLVPITGSAWDDDAISTYQTAMPGYEVLGFTGSWEITDALHCRAKGIPDQYMLYIDHTPLQNGFPSNEGFSVQARIQDFSGTGLIPESIQVVWKVDDGGWNSVQMDPLGNDRYHAFIPPAPSGSTVYYYIHAEDYSERSENHPFIGAPGAHSFDVTPVPDIWISPTEFSVQASTNSVTVETLTIGNDPFAGQNLTFDLTCTHHSGDTWLSVSPTSGSIMPGETQDINVYIRTLSLTPGEYSASIVINSNDPDEPLITIPVDLTVTYGEDFGVSAITSPDETSYEGSNTVSAIVENFGSVEQFNVPVYCEVMEGLFTTFLEEDFLGSFLPSGWTEENAGEWDQSFTSYAGGSSPEARLYWSDIIGDHSYLMSPPVDTFGAALLTLEFKTYVDHYTDTFNVRVWTRASAADSWTDRTPWSNPVGGTFGPNSYQIDISDDIGPDTQVQFEFDGYYWNLDYWYIDDVKIHSETRDPGEIVYTSNTTVDLSGYSSIEVDFSPDWMATPAIYGVRVWTELPGDENNDNDQCIKVVTIIEGIPGDVDGDGDVDINDFLLLLAAWGPCDDCDDCPADFDGNCVVNVIDFLILLANWT